MGDEDELDFEEGEAEQIDYFCGICIDCFDEKKEFLDHINSSSHQSGKSDKLSQLKEGQKYCSHCCTLISHAFEDHCKTHEHVEFVKCLEFVLCDFTPPTLKIVPVEVVVKSAPEIKSRSPSGMVDRIRTKKCIGIPHVERIDDGWFCGLCLEDFDTDLIIHCMKAQHAIQCVKTIDPHTALQLKKFALNNKDKFKELISTKAKEIFDQEKVTEKFKSFMLDLEKEQAKDVKELVPPKEEPAPMETSLSTTPESECIISIFEEADREIIPDAPPPSEVVVDSGKRSSSRGPSSSNHRPVKCKDSTMVIGIKHIVKEGRDYWCDLCGIRCKNNPSSCRNHVTGSLHRRNLITRDQPQPIPKYLQALRSSSPHLYNKILINESMKLEIEERENESKELQELRARILQVKFHNLPPNLCTGTGRDCPGAIKEDDSYNISILAAAWDEELTKKLSASFIKKEKKEVPSVSADPILKSPEQKNPSPPKRIPAKESSSSSSSLITPIQPDEKNLLVGLNEIVKQPNGQYECRMCRIKFSSRKTWSQKSHITGRLHKVKALATRYGAGVEQYLDFKMKKSGYNSLMPEINKACVMLEQQEIESETAETRSLRADILGVRVERLPLPLITLQKDPPYDIQKIAKEWAAKQSPSQPPKPVETKRETPSRAVPKVEVEEPDQSKVEPSVGSTEQEPSTSGIKRDVPIIESDKVPAPDTIISNPNANPPMIKEEQKSPNNSKSQSKPREDNSRRRPETNNKRKSPPDHLLPKTAPPAKPSSTPEPPKTVPPAKPSPPPQQARSRSPARNQQARRPSPQRNQPNRRPSPQRNQPNRRPSPQRNQPNRRPSPQRNQPNRRPSPQRNQQARRPSPQRNQQARRPSPQRNQQNRRPSPQRNQNRGPSPQRNQQNRGARRSPPRNNPNDQRVTSPIRNDRQQRNQPNRRTSPPRNQGSDQTQGNSRQIRRTSPRNDRNSNPRQNTFNNRKSSPPRDMSGRYSPPEPQMSRPQQQQPQHNFQTNNFTNSLPQSMDPQTRSTILQATRDAIAKVFDRNTGTANLGNQTSAVVGSAMINQNGAQMHQNTSLNPGNQQSQNFHPTTPKSNRPFSSFPDNNQMFTQNNMMNHQNMGNNMSNNMGSSVSNMAQTFVGDKRSGPYSMDQNAKRFRDNSLNFR